MVSFIVLASPEGYARTGAVRQALRIGNGCAENSQYSYFVLDFRAKLGYWMGAARVDKAAAGASRKLALLGNFDVG